MDEQTDTERNVKKTGQKVRERELNSGHCLKWIKRKRLVKLRTAAMPVVLSEDEAAGRMGLLIHF